MGYDNLKRPEPTPADSIEVRYLNRYWTIPISIVLAAADGEGINAIKTYIDTLLSECEVTRIFLTDATEKDGTTVEALKKKLNLT